MLYEVLRNRAVGFQKTRVKHIPADDGCTFSTQRTPKESLLPLFPQGGLGSEIGCSSAKGELDGRRLSTLLASVGEDAAGDLSFVGHGFQTAR